MSLQLKKDFVYNAIRNEISLGKLLPNEKLPAGTLLAKKLNVSHMTVRSALEKLVEDGFINVINGRGIFVVDREKKSTEKKILVVCHNNYNDISPAGRIIPSEFCRLCNEAMVTTEIVDMIFMRNIKSQEGINKLLERNYMGVFILGNDYNGDENELNIVRKLNIPTLLVHGTADDFVITKFSTLRTFYKKAWTDGVQYLREKSYKRISCLLVKGDKPRGLTLSEHSNLLKNINSEFHDEYIQTIEVTNDINHDEVYERVKTLMNLPQAPDVIFCYSDFVAQSVYLACERLNISIPNDVAVMGFCGVNGSDLLSPPLTTIDVNYLGLAKKASELLLRGELDADNPQEYVLSHKILERESV